MSEQLWQVVRFAANNAAIDAFLGQKLEPSKIIEVSVKAAFGLALQQGMITITPEDTWPYAIPMRYDSTLTPETVAAQAAWAAGEVPKVSPSEDYKAGDRDGYGRGYRAGRDWGVAHHA